MPEDQSWRSWTEMCLRELTQLRADIDRHMTEHREDISRLTDKIERLNEKFTELSRSLETFQQESDRRQDLAIQKLQIEAESYGKQAGASSGKEAAETAMDTIAASVRKNGATISVVVTAVIVGLVEAYRIIITNKP